MLDTKARAKAIRLTPKYAYDCEWVGHFDEILDLISYPRPVAPGGPDMGTFVECVAAYQSMIPGLKSDGILGPNTWTVMKIHMTQPPHSAALPPAFDNIPAKSKAKATPGGRQNSGAWVGLVIDYGVMLGPLAIGVGKNYAIGTVYSIDDPNRHFLVSADRFRIGVGGGGGLGAALVFVNNCYDPNDMHGYKSSGADFNISLGAKFGAIAKGAINAQRWSKLISTFNKLKLQGLGGDAMHRGITKLAQKTSELGPDEIGALAKAYKESDAMKEGLKDSKTIKVHTLTLPIGIAVEASAFWQEEEWTTGAQQESKPADFRQVGTGMGELYGPYPGIGM